MTSGSKSKSKNEVPMMMQGFAALNPDAATKSLELMSSGVQFMSMRLDHTLKAQKDLLSCTTPAEVLNVQTDYVKTAIEHYMMATQGVMDLMGEQMRAGASGTKRGYDDVPL